MLTLINATTIINSMIASAILQGDNRSSNRSTSHENKNSVAFVTGANRGLGLAFAKELVARGASKVYAGVRNPEGVNIPGVIAIRLDVSDPASVAAAVAQAGDVTSLVNNAGIARLLPSMLDPGLVEAAREIFETNYYGVMHVSLAFAPYLKPTAAARSSTYCRMRPGLPRRSCPPTRHRKRLHGASPTRCALNSKVRAPACKACTSALSTPT